MDKEKDKKSAKKQKPGEEAKVDSGKSTAKKTNVSKKKPSEVKAKLRFLRMSPKKVRMVRDLIKGMKAVEAVDYLKLVSKAATAPLIKLINSAIANAVNNFELEKDNLYIVNITVNQGPTLKRWKPRAHGRAAPIRKRSSHIEIVLVEKKEEPKIEADKKAKPKKLKVGS